jgi:hypothetical protein
MFTHGSNYHLKSVFQSGPLADVTKSVSKRLSELNGATGNEIQHYYLFEYVPHRVALTVPEGATAFLRTSRGMTGSALKWTGNTPGIDEIAKRAARELTNIVAETEARVSGKDKLDNSGYGNFSQYLLPSVSMLRVSNCRTRWRNRLRGPTPETRRRIPT